MFITKAPLIFFRKDVYYVEKNNHNITNYYFIIRRIHNNVMGYVFRFNYG